MIIKSIISGGDSLRVSTDPWSVDTQYRRNKQVALDGRWYVCIADHISAAESRPDTGASWTQYWAEQILPFIVDIAPDLLELNYAPVNYSPKVTPGTSSIAQLGSHMAGIDEKIADILAQL